MNVSIGSLVTTGLLNRCAQGFATKIIGEEKKKKLFQGEADLCIRSPRAGAGSVRSTGMDLLDSGFRRARGRD